MLVYCCMYWVLYCIFWELANILHHLPSFEEVLRTSIRMNRILWPDHEQNQEKEYLSSTGDNSGLWGVQVYPGKQLQGFWSQRKNKTPLRMKLFRSSTLDSIAPSSATTPTVKHWFHPVEMHTRNFWSTDLTKTPQQCVHKLFGPSHCAIQRDPQQYQRNKRGPGTRVCRIKRFSTTG